MLISALTHLQTLEHQQSDSSTMKVDAKNMKALYEANGYLTAIHVLDEKQLLHARQEYEKLEEKFGKEYTQYNLHNIHLEYEWVMNLASHPKLLEAITAVLGPNVILLDSRFICKYPASDVPHKENTVPYVAWHQDIKYWGFEGGPVASVWLAFDDVDSENGVLQVIPGSHKLGILEHRIAEIPGNMLTANQEIPKHLVNIEDLVECPLKAGQMSVHDGLTVHASEPNMSERRRCGFVIRYVPTTAYPIQDPERPRTFPATVLVAGSDENHHFQNHAPHFFTKTL
ncbi:probable alpha-ketoglutarate-dependent hypophosphite dioxygenase [Pyxicephalus adspersus]|uniref:probable alpha-ketoglutarate-dependent hypophosphite dioxygenase n=1 Tax=Pyxicephalus adspersus TaxID=30357 RepID=UPI003B5BCC80